MEHQQGFYACGAKENEKTSKRSRRERGNHREKSSLKYMIDKDGGAVPQPKKDDIGREDI